jgi:hypothetical protein
LLLIIMGSFPWRVQSQNCIAGRAYGPFFTGVVVLLIWFAPEMSYKNYETGGDSNYPDEQVTPINM